MNKLATTLAGLALVAGASIAPAFAQNFSANGPFTFTFSPTVLAVNNIAASYNQVSGPTILGTLSLTGGKSTNGTTFTGNTLTFTGTSGGTFTDTETNVTAFVNSFGNGTFLISGAVPTGTFTLLPGTATAPVPEASTVISFGALLALGGLAVLRRKSVAKNAA